MNCSLCNAETTRKTEDHLCRSKILGDVLVPLVEVESCMSCGASKLSTEAEGKISDYLKMLEKDAINSLPADILISAGQAAAILGVSKQAFSKNPKIKKGFVYFTMIGTKKFFFRSSLKLYKKSGDGRFPITRWRSSVSSGKLVSSDADREKWQQISSTGEPADNGANGWHTLSQVSI